MIKSENHLYVRRYIAACYSSIISEVEHRDKDPGNRRQG